MVRPTASTDDFNPASFRMDFQVPASYLEPLVRPDDVSMEPRPNLAQSWQVDSNGREVTFRLRDGVHWHDGTEFSATDVAFSFEVCRDDVNSAVVNQVALLDVVETIDVRTVRVRLLDNDPTWLFNASSLPIIQAAQYRPAWERLPTGARTLSGFDWRSSPPVGTGPWRLTDWGRQGVAFDRNEDYWGQPAWMDRFELSWEAGEQRRLETWTEGNTDILWPVRIDSLPALNGPSARLYAADSARVMFAAYNFDNPTSPIAGVLDDLAVRQALSLGVDRRAVGDQVFGGIGRSFAAGTVA
ncbi:MAG TPA: ABC transporter substrate-binding protein, partial [Thermomicrobiales bacterium]|nr:ABC transporter substrate-binding protein [Thermomicrobiales bacterium]